MMERVQEVIATVKVKVLVFGPSPDVAKDQTRMGAIARKRLEIRDKIRQNGDLAEFPEDLLRASNPLGKTVAPILLQEIIFVRDFDLVVILVESPGSQVELGNLASRTDLAKKTQTYIDLSYKAGLAFDTCEMISQLGGESHTFQFPADIDECHLLTKVVNLIDRTRLMKFLA